MTPPITGTDQGLRRRRLLLAGALVLVTGTVTVLVVVSVGSLARVPWSGLAARDVRVSWLLPAARVGADLAAAATVGCLVAAALLIRGPRVISPAAYRWLRAATWPAVVWAAAVVLSLPGLLVEFLNTDLAGVGPAAVLAFVRDTPVGAAQATAGLLATVVAVGSRLVLTTAGARTLLGLAVLAVVPPAVAEYAEAEGTATEVAVAATGMALHVLGALVWSGTLAALVLVQLPGDEVLPAVRRYSRAAPVLVLAVGGSGLLSAAFELGRPGGRWLDTEYGRLVLLKVLALVALVAVGWWHRRRTLPTLARGGTGALRRIAAVELVIFAVTFGLAVGLSRTPPPALDPIVDQQHTGSAQGVLPGTGLDRSLEA